MKLSKKWRKGAKSNETETKSSETETKSDETDVEICHFKPMVINGNKK